MLLFAKCWRWSIDHVKVRPDLFDAKSRYSIKDNGNLHLWVFNLNFNQIPFSVTNFNLIGDKKNKINYSFNFISIFFSFRQRTRLVYPTNQKVKNPTFVSSGERLQGPTAMLVQFAPNSHETFHHKLWARECELWCILQKSKITATNFMTIKN